MCWSLSRTVRIELMWSCRKLWRRWRNYLCLWWVVALSYLIPVNVDNLKLRISFRNGSRKALTGGYADHSAAAVSYLYSHTSGLISSTLPELVFQISHLNCACRYFCRQNGRNFRGAGHRWKSGIEAQPLCDWQVNVRHLRTTAVRACQLPDFQSTTPLHLPSGLLL